MFTILDTDNNAYTEYYKQLKQRGYPKEYLDKQDTIDFMLTKSTHHFRLECDPLRDDNECIEVTRAEHIELHRLMYECYPCKETNGAYQFIRGSHDNRGNKNAFFGKHHSEESKQKNREAHKGNKYWLGKTHSEEAKRKISEANKGKTRSEEYKRKQSEATKGKNNPMYNKHHSEETKRKISDAHKGKGKLVKVFFNNGDELIFSSIRECSEYLKVREDYLSKVISGKLGVPKRCNVKKILRV